MTKKKHLPKGAGFIPQDQLVPSEEEAPEDDPYRTDFTMLKCRCLKCRLHFILCTWHPERHSNVTIHCPECGQRGEGLVLWQEHVNQPISATVPGNAQPVTGTLPRREPWDN
jgi:hypothetical protein